MFACDCFLFHRNKMLQNPLKTKKTSLTISNRHSFHPETPKHPHQKLSPQNNPIWNKERCRKSHFHGKYGKRTDPSLGIPKPREK